MYASDGFRSLVSADRWQLEWKLVGKLAPYLIDLWSQRSSVGVLMRFFRPPWGTGWKREGHQCELCTNSYGRS